MQGEPKPVRVVINNAQEERLLRHGEVMLIRRQGLPENARENHRVGPVLAGHGAHAHVLSNGRFFTTATQRFVELEEPAELTHPEHGTLDVPAGVWEVKVAREYVPPAPPDFNTGQRGSHRTVED